MGQSSPDRRVALGSLGSSRAAQDLLPRPEAPGTHARGACRLCWCSSGTRWQCGSSAAPGKRLWGSLGAGTPGTPWASLRIPPRAPCHTSGGLLEETWEEMLPGGCHCPVPPTGWMLAISGNQSWCWQRGWLCCPSTPAAGEQHAASQPDGTHGRLQGSKTHLQGSKPCLCCVRALAVLRPHTPVILLVGKQEML